MRALLVPVLVFLVALSFSSLGCNSDAESNDGDVQSGLDVVADLAAPEEVASGTDVPVADVPAADLPAADLPGPDDTESPDVVEVAEEVVPEVVTPEFPLGVGDPVPDFSLPAHDGSTFTLSDYAGQYVLFSSYPAATTSVCTWQTCFVNENYDQFVELNTVPVGLSTDGLGVLAQWAIDEGYQQLLLSDTQPMGEVSKMFGIYDEGYGVTMRANTIVGPEGTIVFQKVYAMGEKPDFTEIFEFLGQ